MKSLILILLSLSLVGLSSNSYAEVGDFITSFDGSDGWSGEFTIPLAVAVDSDNRIIVADTDLIQIFNPDGSFVGSIDGIVDGTEFVNISGIAIDSSDRIIVADAVIVKIFNSDGSFFASFDGTDGIGGTPFVRLFGIAVDSSDRIIVADLKLVKIFNPDGTFVTSFDGTDGIGFFYPSGVAVDSSDRILVVDPSIVQIFDSDGKFLASFSGTGGTVFSFRSAVAVDSNNRIIVTHTDLHIVQIFEGFDYIAEPPKRSGSGSCGDCTPPTLGLDKNSNRVVDNGFSYNNSTVQVDRWHTPFPLINATVGEMNIVEVIIYENQGTDNMKMVQFGLGGEEIGQSLSTFEVLVEVPLFKNYTSGYIETDELTITDKDNLIENSSVNATSNIVSCGATTSSCLKVILEYSYLEPTINHIMVVNVQDNSRNSQNFYFNEGIQVLGDSLNEPPTYKLSNKKLKQQTENLWLTLTRTDKVNHIWTDGDGIEYKQISENRFDRITPQESYKCTDPPLDQVNVPTRNNCHFRDQTVLWTYN